ncbi:MAG: restriction endonuclease subunit S [Pseudomonadota bacterium]
MALTKSIAEIISEDTSGLLGIHPKWTRVRLGDVASVLNGFPFESAFFSTDSGVPLIRIRDVSEGTTRTFYRGEFDEQFLVQRGELLIGMDGDFNAARWRSEPALLNQRVCKLTPVERWYNSSLLELALPGYLSAINAATSSITVKHLSSRSIEDIELPLPPRNEQDRIVEKLEELLSDLDAGVAELKAAQRKLAQYRQSLLKAAVEGTLTADWRAARARSGEPQETGADLLQRILTERRARWEAKQLAKYAEQGKTPPKGWQAKYPEPMPPETTDLPTLPDGWLWTSVEQLAELVSGHTPKDASQYAESAGEIHWFKVGDMNVEGNEEELATASVRFSRKAAADLGLKVVPSGTIVFPKRGGAIATNKKRRLGIPGAYDLNMMGLVTTPSAANWLWSWFKSIDLASLSDGSNVPQINNPDIAPLCVPLPPTEEQEAILARLDVALNACDEQVKAVQLGLLQAAAQRKNILKAAFTGQLAPQDPNDEPASALLERIRAERAATGQTSNRKRGRKAREQG